MDADFCKNCERLQIILIENTHRGSHHQSLPFRTVFVQLRCGGGTILATEPVGKAELVNDDYAIFCEPNGTCSNIITRQFLSGQMQDDYDDALARAFARIDGYGRSEQPPRCAYEFEQELSDISRNGWHGGIQEAIGKACRK